MAACGARKLDLFVLSRARPAAGENCRRGRKTEQRRVRINRLISRMTAAKIGIIGGSGLYQMPELTEFQEIEVQTPFGSPSDKFMVGALEGERVAFLPRHGAGHKLTPTEVPFRANIYAMKLLGADRILSASALGSLQEKYAPLDMVIPDQFFDRTRDRKSTRLNSSH